MYNSIIEQIFVVCYRVCALAASMCTIVYLSRMQVWVMFFMSLE